MATIEVTDSSLFFSPWNWYSDGGGSMQANNVKGSSTYAQSNNPGAYLKFKVTIVTTGDVVVNFDNAHLSGIASGDFPQVAVWKDSGAPTVTQLSGTSTQALTIGSSLTAGTYSFVMVFKAAGLGSGNDRWSTPAISIKVDSLTVPNDATMVAPVMRSRKLLVFGDSITEGVHALGTTLDPADQDAAYCWPHFVAAALDAEVGVVGFGGQGYTASGVGSVPAFPGVFDDYSSGRSRLVSSAFSPVPDMVIVAHGENDTTGGSLSTTIGSALTSVRAAAGSAPIVVMVPFTGKCRSDIEAASLPSDTRIVDVNKSGGDGSHLVYYPGFQSPLHPSLLGSAYLAPRIAKLIDRGGIKTARTVTLPLTTNGTTAASSLSSLKWAWWDQAEPQDFTAPTSQGSAETTDGSGELVLSINTALPSGGVGWLTITDSDGTTTQSPAHKAFSGPAEID